MKYSNRVGVSVAAIVFIALFQGSAHAQSSRVTTSDFFLGSIQRNGKPLSFIESTLRSEGNTCREVDLNNNNQVLIDCKFTVDRGQGIFRQLGIWTPGVGYKSIIDISGDDEAIVPQGFYKDNRVVADFRKSKGEKYKQVLIDLKGKISAHSTVSIPETFPVIASPNGRYAVRVCGDVRFCNKAVKHTQIGYVILKDGKIVDGLKYGNQPLFINDAGDVVVNRFKDSSNLSTTLFFLRKNKKFHNLGKLSTEGLSDSNASGQSDYAPKAINSRGEIAIIEADTDGKYQLHIMDKNGRVITSKGEVNSPVVDINSIYFTVAVLLDDSSLIYASSGNRFVDIEIEYFPKGSRYSTTVTGSNGYDGNPIFANEKKSVLYRLQGDILSLSTFRR